MRSSVHLSHLRRRCLFEERNLQDACRRITILKRESADRNEHLYVVRKDSTEMVALRDRQTISILADDVGQPSFDFLALFRSQTGEAAIGSFWFSL